MKPRGSFWLQGFDSKKQKCSGFCISVGSNILFVAFFLCFGCVQCGVTQRRCSEGVSVPMPCWLPGGKWGVVWREALNTWKEEAWHSLALHCTTEMWFDLKPFPPVREQV